ncbi:MAG: BON domain-containing protein [Cellvibrionaceae bacterium]|nr:BON domain-containing protein [Cellvibrionaceae bacterium]
MNAFIFTLLLSMSALLSGCTSIVDATTSEPIKTTPGKRTFGTYVDDKRLEVIIGVNIRKADPELKKAHITITSFNGVVLLTGQVPNAALKQLATTTTTGIDSVRKAYNELQIKDNSSFLSRTSDSWLATKVKATLLGDEQIKGLNVKNIVEDGTVYLMGLVTLDESNQIANVVSNIRGVKEVVKVFEYIEADAALP